MPVSLFGVPYSRSLEADWFDNPHEAVARAKKVRVRKIIWLFYDSENPRRTYDYTSPACQSVFNIADFVKRQLAGFAPADSPVWKRDK